MKNNQIIKTNKFISEHAFIARVVPMEIAKENPALVNLYCALILKSLKNMRSTKDLNDFNSMNYCSSINFIGRYFEDSEYSD